ncbi:MAG: GntR family transcriptional regulator [Actinobacteria bacterium]|nr:GntR family transcriptional regulator [Actinomycetota bacterium]
MAPARNDVIQRVSIVDNVTDGLRNALLAGEIKPGERLRVAELEKRFGVSHIPIREAVRRLETEGLVVALPQRAAVAAGVDLDDLRGLYDIRRIIECEVVRRSIDAMTDEQVDDVRAALAALEGVARDHDSPPFWEAHGAFHWALLAPGATAWIERVLGQVWLASQRYVRLFVSQTVDDAMRDHRELYACCVERDGARAGAVLRLHLDRTEQAVRRAFLSTPAEERAS